jgi:cation/acetate symporter
MADPAKPRYAVRLARYALIYGACFLAFVWSMALLERIGLSHAAIGYIFVFATIALYAFVGLGGRTADLDEYYVAGRRVPAFFNGMATGADWMSAATFISLTGTVYLTGFDGLVYVMGWTGGYCLVALLLAPYLRAFGQFTVPDFLGARYGGTVVRLFGALAAILCSFIYVIAQIYGVGLITSRFTGVEFGIGVFLGLAGILVCSFLGGMRAITWTQVAQYIVLMVAFLLPAVMLSLRYTDSYWPQLSYGSVLEKLELRERALARDPGELEVRGIFAERAREISNRLVDLPRSWEEGRLALRASLEAERDANASFVEVRGAERAIAEYPKDANAARASWSAGRDEALVRAAAPLVDSEPFPGSDAASRDGKRLNFLALLFCLMVGTAGLPHILTRYYTTPSVQETRKSVAWSLFFIALLYWTVPALAVLVKYDVISQLVGTSYTHLPSWVGSWGAVDKLNPLVSIVDTNHDGIVQFSEIVISPDVFMLAIPEIAGLPYFVSGLVAAGGLAAALSTADGLLLTIASAISHDTYFKLIDPAASNQKRVTLSKIVLLIVALAAAYVTSLRPGDILAMVGAAFSIAASAFFPALVLGIFWRGANRWGATAGMIVGLSTCVYYMCRTYPFFTDRIGFPGMARWWGIDPISSGVFGVPAGIATIIVVSVLTRSKGEAANEFLTLIRSPDLTK